MTREIPNSQSLVVKLGLRQSAGTASTSATVVAEAVGGVQPPGVVNDNAAIGFELVKATDGAGSAWSSTAATAA